MCNEAGSSDWLTPLNRTLRESLYEKVLEQLTVFKTTEENHNRILPKDLISLMEAGVQGAEKYWPALFDANRDITFLRIDPEALVITKASGTFFETTPLRLLYKQLPKHGVYKARIVIRYVFINDPTRSEQITQRRIVPNLYVDQLFYSPENSRAPSEIAMDPNTFFSVDRRVELPDISSFFPAASDNYPAIMNTVNDNAPGSSTAPLTATNGSDLDNDLSSAAVQPPKKKAKKSSKKSSMPDIDSLLD